MPGDGRAKQPTGVLFVLLLAGVSFALSQTLVVPALAAISEEMDASQTATSWVLTGFLLSASIATPIVGKLGDLLGKGRVLTAVLLLFALGGAVCALAGSIGVLIGGRVIQGVAGGVFPLAFGIVRDTFPPDRVAGGLGIDHQRDLRDRRRHRPAALGRRRRQPRPLRAVLDQPDR